LCCFSSVVVVYFVIDLVRKLLDTPSYIPYADSKGWLVSLGFGRG